MMRRSLLAILLVVLVVPALSGPASARQHSYRHHYRFARQHGLPVRADNFAPGLYAYAPDGYAPDALAPEALAPAFAKRETNLRRNTLRQNDWRRDNWRQDNWRQDNWRQNDWSQSGFGQNSRSQNSFNQSTPLDGMASAQASANGVPASLVERVIKRESGGNPRAVSRGNYGLMQIRLGTARAMGFSGSAAELLDPQVNMTYAVRYLAGAYRAAGGNENRAVALYARGYYYQAKAQGFSPYASGAGVGFGDYSPGAFQTAENVGDGAPVYRARHRRHRAV
jgi:soluble lytic murein transglycosylase-like protein